MTRKYIVQEIDTYPNGQIQVLPAWAFDELYSAEAKFHSVLATLANSSLACATCMLYNNEGDLLRSEKYIHETTEETTEEPTE